MQQCSLVFILILLFIFLLISCCDKAEIRGEAEMSSLHLMTLI